MQQQIPSSIATQAADLRLKGIGSHRNRSISYRLPLLLFIKDKSHFS